MNRLFVALAFLSLSVVSCTDKAETDGNGESVRFISAVPEGATRTLLTDNSSSISGSWQKGDTVSLFNISVPSGIDEFLFAQESAKTSVFRGYATCKANDRLALFYPACNNTSVINIDGLTKVRLSLKGQNGNLSTLARRYDFCYSEAFVGSVSGFYATASFGVFKNIVAIMKASILDDSANPVTNIQSITLSATGFSTVQDFDLENETYDSANSDSESLTVYCTLPSQTLYIAIFPFVGAIDYTATTFDGNTYTGTFPMNVYKAGGAYEVQGN